jgi:hypothetical protein
MTVAELVQKLGEMRDTLIGVSTGGPRIDQVNQRYRELYAEVGVGLGSYGLENTIPYSDLWQWYGRWSSGDLPSYQSRRVHIGEIFSPLIASLRSGHVERPHLPTGWEKVDRTIGKARNDLASATHEEDFQLVGVLCREALISLAQAVYDARKHPTGDVAHVSSTDFKRMIEAYIATELAGASSEEMRRHATAAFNLANNLQHKRTANFRLAAICLEATASVVNIIAIVSGRRDPS